DDLLARPGKRPRELRRGAVGKREEEERDVAGRERRRVGGDEDEAPVDPPDRGHHLGERLARERARRDGGELDPGVTEEEPHERLARVTRRAYDANFH